MVKISINIGYIVIIKYSSSSSSLECEKCTYTCSHVCVGNLNFDYRVCHRQASPFAPLHHYLQRGEHPLMWRKSQHWLHSGGQSKGTPFTDGQRRVVWCGVCNAKYLCHCGKDALRVKDVGGPSTRWHLWLGQSRLLMDLDSMQNLWPWTPIQYPDCNNMNQVLGTTVQEIRDEDILDQSRSTISSPQLITRVLPAHSS